MQVQVLPFDAKTDLGDMASTYSLPRIGAPGISSPLDFVYQVR